ncbi:hypothetical protein EXIGLDRAFT_807812 [Exidia glandulosa HHB12029]|uniref:Protein kinase domain-containing protein n=1 Tax=Exidia glandulosa HHB12029 TaxID=1314781 RepID=A0A165D5Y7_EXIGL|nr:hypothetical protein EXIGLDRAFT_807812 [Exidia glandulosa HHB12029]
MASTTTLPTSIKELKSAPTPHEIHGRTLWEPFVPFFASHGITLWNAGENANMSPPDDRVRAPDGFFYRTAQPWDPSFFHRGGFSLRLPTVCPGRTTDGRDVVIRITSIGDDCAHHRIALKRLATGNVATLIGNHTVPVLQWLTLENITFAVQPMLSWEDPTSEYCYEDVEDLLKTMIQMLEGVAFCHSKLVAHLDLWEGNFLCNYFGDRGPARFSTHDRTKVVPPFRTTFPFKVYIIDFESCVLFDEDSDPSTRVHSGPPPGFDIKKYARIKYPELLSDAPYNPFLVDVWQLGVRFKCLFAGCTEEPDDLEEPDIPWAEGEGPEDMEPPVPLKSLPAAVVALVERMTAENPAERPTAAVALAELRSIFSKLSKDELRALV